MAYCRRQIAAYVEYEKRLTGNKIIAIVANTEDDRITVWKSAVEDDRKLVSEGANPYDARV